jgi:transposase
LWEKARATWRKGGSVSIEKRERGLSAFRILLVKSLLRTLTNRVNLHARPTVLWSMVLPSQTKEAKMSLHPQDLSRVPENTAQVARAAFPNGNPYLTLWDELGVIYEDAQFASLFTSSRGRPAESPGRLALVTALQFAEDLSDRQAADAVRGRIDWKYLLELELTDPGFDYSVLSAYRDRILEGGMERRLLDLLLERLEERGLIRKRGQQCSDSTDVLAAIQELNRLECVGETLRHALNSLAVVVPDWLREYVPQEWFERYGQRFDQWRLPDDLAERDALGEQIGRDGHDLLQAVYGHMRPSGWGECQPSRYCVACGCSSITWKASGCTGVSRRQRGCLQLPR